jgi:hypothetical protein
VVEFLAVQVAFGPDVAAPAISLSGGTMTISIPQPQSGTILAGTVLSTSFPEGGFGRIVASRLIPAWDQILARAQDIARSTSRD